MRVCVYCLYDACVEFTRVCVSFVLPLSLCVCVCCVLICVLFDFLLFVLCAVMGMHTCVHVCALRVCCVCAVYNIHAHTADTHSTHTSITFLIVLPQRNVCVCVHVRVNEDFIIIQPRQSRSKNDIERQKQTKKNVIRFLWWLWPCSLHIAGG